MRKCFGQIFWGLLLVILDVRINGFDLLPDVIGWILVAVGTGGLVAASPLFGTASALSWILAALALVSIFTVGELSLYLGIAYVIVDCLQMWMLLGGIMDLALSRNRYDLVKRASNRRLAYVVIMVAVKIVALLGHSSQDLAGPLAVVIVLAMLVLLVMILHLIYRVRKELAR